MKTFKTKFLYSLSKKILKKYHPDIIGIVGSVGKTTTKEAIYSVLSSKFNVRKNIGSNHNDIEIPLAIIGVDINKAKECSFSEFCALVFRAINLLIFKNTEYPDVLILEIGINQPGDLEYLSKYISFHIGIVTSTELTSLNSFTSVRKLADEQEIIISKLSKDDIAILNVDDDLVNSMRTKAQRMTFGIINNADLKANEPAISLNNDTPSDDLLIKGISFKINYKGSVVPILIPKILGTHQIYSILAAVMCGLVYQMNLSEISHNLKEYHPPAGRMRLLKGIKKTLLIDDTYSSSPISTRAAVRAASLIPLKEGAESYAILGDMMDLGGMSENEHSHIGHLVAEKGINKLITVGERSKDIALAAREAGMQEDKVFSFDDVKSAGSFLQDRLEENDIVLIKGSKEMRMENIVKELMADPMSAKKLLINRDK